jgi:hypothetical protein
MRHTSYLQTINGETSRLQGHLLTIYTQAVTRISRIRHRA